jgi:hypothetical protein
MSLVVILASGRRPVGSSLLGTRVAVAARWELAGEADENRPDGGRAKSNA